jgi:hypothetical protein
MILKNYAIVPIILESNILISMPLFSLRARPIIRGTITNARRCRKLLRSRMETTSPR